VGYQDTEDRDRNNSNDINNIAASHSSMKEGLEVEKRRGEK